MRRLLDPLLWRLQVWLLRRPEAIDKAPPGYRRDEVRLRVQHGLTLAVYWKVTDLGAGPAVVLQTDRIELMKFDCFGGEGGHFHVAPWYHARLVFLERTVEDQVARAIAELRSNASVYLRHHPDSDISSIRIDHSKLATALDEAEVLLRKYAAISYELAS